MMRASLRLVGIAVCFSISTLVLLMIPSQLKYRFTKSMFGILCRIAGLRITVVGEPVVTAPHQTLLVANHISYLDPIVIGSLFKTNFMAKLEVRSWPLIGWACRAMQHLFVHRELLSRRVLTLRSLKRHLQFENVCLFPEGTTTRSRLPARELWKAGSLWAATPHTTQIVCLGIAYEDQDRIAWVDDMAFAPHLWSVLKQRQTRTCIAIKSLAYAPFQADDKRTSAKMLCSTVETLCRQAHNHFLLFPTHSQTNSFSQEALCNRPTFNL